MFVQGSHSFAMFAQKIFLGARYVDDLYRIFWKLSKLHCMAPHLALFNTFRTIFLLSVVVPCYTLSR